MKKKSSISKLSIQEQVAYLNNNLNYKTLVKPPKWWLDTGFPRLNAVLGSRKFGLVSGKIYLLAGKESSGKSLLAAKLGALAQQHKAIVTWVDGENSYDPDHVRRQGLHPSKVALFEPEYGVFGKKTKKGKAKKSIVAEGVEPAEYLFQRVETWMKLQRKVHGDKIRQIVIVDSISAFSPSEEEEAGFTDQNMRTRMSPAVLLNLVTKKFQPLAVHTNAIVILISQLRTNPSKMFGNPDYIPGGGGTKFFPASITWMRRIAGGSMYHKKKRVGVKGLLTNHKNKVGGDSVEQKEYGYETKFFTDAWRFVSKEAIQKKLKK